jgi:hypothetical protein
MGVNRNANRYNMRHRIHVYVQHTRGATWIADLVDIGVASVVNILPELSMLNTQNLEVTTTVNSLE